MTDNKNIGISKDLVAASATPLVLSILGQGETYGYLIIKRVRSYLEARWSGRTGCCIRFCIVWKTGPDRIDLAGIRRGRKRKYYRLKDAGVRSSTFREVIGCW